MNLKTLSFTTLTLAAALLPADAYFRAGFKISKEYRQIGSDTPAFRGGEAYLYVVDGILTVTGCVRNGQSSPFGINTMLGCNIGSNGVSFDGDGSPIAEFKEIVGVEAATTVEPGRHDLVSLYARPSYDFPQNALGVSSIATVLFYDLLSANGDIREYRLAGRGLASNRFVPGYSFQRTYGSGDRARMEREITNGIYQFKFPMLGRPNTPLYINFPVRATVEGYVERPIKQGFRFTNVGPFDSNGFAQYDQNLISNFTWTGLTAGGVSSGDRLYIGFRKMSTASEADSALVTTGGLYPQEVFDFPPESTSIPYFPGTRILLTSPVQSFYNLPAGFFSSPDTTVLELTLERDPRVGLSAVSVRKFQLPIRFVAGFPGAMAAAFPKDTDPALMAKDADPDGDGVPNWLEWISGTDPYTANAPASLSQMTFVPSSTRRSGQTIPAYWYMAINRTANLPERVGVEIESSTDLHNWTKVSENDPHWIIEDIRSEPHVRILSRTPEITDQRYFRVRYNDPG